MGKIFVVIRQEYLNRVRTRGFLIGTVLGIVCGITLGRVPLLADIFSP